MLPINYLTQVNLVSEHIWCNDFLVRSFYLKNVQTQETRTLTQFHFLSWPAKGIPTSTRPLLDFRRYCTCSQTYMMCLDMYEGLIMMICSNGNNIIILIKCYEIRAILIIIIQILFVVYLNHLLRWDRFYFLTITNFFIF